MSLFRKTELYAVETVRQRLAECDAAMHATESDLTDAALASVLDDTDIRADAAAATMAALRQRREVLVRALADAEQREAVARAEREKKEAAARLRALRSHQSRIAKHGEEFETAGAAMVDAWRKMTEAAASARALLPARRVFEDAAPHEHVLRRFAELHIAKIGSRAGHLGPEPWPPGAPQLLAGATPETTPSLCDALAEQGRSLIQRFATAAGLELSRAHVHAGGSSSGQDARNDLAAPQASPEPTAAPEAPAGQPPPRLYSEETISYTPPPDLPIEARAIATAHPLRHPRCQLSVLPFRNAIVYVPRRAHWSGLTQWIASPC